MVLFVALVFGLQLSAVLSLPLESSKSVPFDLQGHRGGRGNTIENTLPSFAWGMMDGVTTLEMDNGITKDGVVVVWHDMFIPPEKCRDTAPAFKDDPAFPYVGKNIHDLTLAQIKTLDCSKRLIDFPMQLVYPGTKMSTLKEVFAFADCADPGHRIQFNIESKINPVDPSTTAGVDEFVTRQHAEFLASPYNLKSITYQSFDWRTLIGMKALDKRVTTVALVSSDTIIAPANGTSPWLAGRNLTEFAGSTIGAQIASAARSVAADILSPLDIDGKSPVPDPTEPGFIPFTTKAMVDQAHELGMLVKTWTDDRVSVADELLDWGVDGLITDFPTQMRRRIVQRGMPVAEPFSQQKVMDCLARHLQTV